MPDREVPIGGATEFQEGQLVWRKLPDFGLEIIVCLLMGSYYAIENRCSHQERRMDGAKREYQEIRCPHHGVCYDLRDGSVRWDQGFRDLIPCKSFKVFERDKQVYLVLPESESIY